MGGVLEYRIFDDPQIVKYLFSSTKVAILWLVIRLYVGWEWLQAGWYKAIGEDSWITDNGMSLLGFWNRIVVVPKQGRPAISYDWYRDFIQFMIDKEWHTWMAPLVAWGEILVGVALLAGAFTGIAAFFGAFMNFNFMLAGSAGSNPVLFIFALILILAWKVAGYIGLDRFLLPMLGTPWRGGTLFNAVNPQVK